MDQEGRPAAPADSTRGRVDAIMRHVRYHVDADLVLAIDRLDGGLAPTPDATLPSLDEPTSFRIDIRRATIAIDTASLSRLLDRYVFAYDGSPLDHLSVSIERGLLRQHGTLHALVPIPFTIVAEASVTPDGEIRLEPRKVEALGIGVRGLLRTLGLRLASLVESNRAHGVRVVENVIYLDPAGLLPPPRIRGRLRALELRADRVVLQFGAADPADATPAASDSLRNYLAFRHGSLRFGKLTMRDTDLRIIDTDPDTPFEFSLERYQAQLVAGLHRTTADTGLVVWMPDLTRLDSLARRRKAGGGSR